MWFHHNDTSHECLLLALGEIGTARRENAAEYLPTPVTTSNGHISKSTVSQIAVNNLALAATNGRVNAVESKEMDVV